MTHKELPHKTMGRGEVVSEGWCGGGSHNKAFVWMFFFVEFTSIHMCWGEISFKIHSNPLQYMWIDTNLVHVCYNHLGLWNVRNKTGIEKKFPRSCNEVFHKIFMFMQKWRILLKEQDVGYMDDKIRRMKTWLLFFLEEN